MSRLSFPTNGAIHWHWKDQSIGCARQALFIPRPVNPSVVDSWFSSTARCYLFACSGYYLQIKNKKEEEEKSHFMETLSVWWIARNCMLSMPLIIHADIVSIGPQYNYQCKFGTRRDDDVAVASHCMHSTYLPVTDRRYTRLDGHGICLSLAVWISVKGHSGILSRSPRNCATA